MSYKYSSLFVRIPFHFSIVPVFIYYHEVG